MPALAAAPGMPHTTLEASSWAITLPPAATISLPPRIPSEPMPVSTTARTPPCQTSIAEVKSGSTAGLQKLTGGPSLGITAPTFGKVGASLSKFVEINKNTTLAMNIQGGTTFGTVPQFAQFRLGGWNGMRGYRRWHKDGHLSRIKESGFFSFTKEIYCHSVEEGGTDRLIGLIKSQSDIAELLKSGLSDEEIGLSELRKSVDASLSGRSLRWFWSYQIRIAVK